MCRTATCSRMALALLAPALLWCAAWGGQAEEGAPRPDVNLRVVVLAASGRAEKPHFDPRTPRDLRRQIEEQNLAYGKYDLVANHRRDARFGADVAFDLPDKETLVIRATADDERASRLRVACRLLDAGRKPILVNTMRVSLGRAFIIQRAKGPANSLLLGISAHKPSEPPAK